MLCELASMSEGPEVVNQVREHMEELLEEMKRRAGKASFDVKKRRLGSSHESPITDQKTARSRARRRAKGWQRWRPCIDVTWAGKDFAICEVTTTSRAGETRHVPAPCQNELHSQTDGP